MAHALRGKSAIVGKGYWGLGKTPNTSPMELIAKATQNALADAGMDLSEIDGVCGGTFYHFFPTLSITEYLGIKPTWANSDMVGGSSFMSYLVEATMAIQAGLCKNVLICYGSNAKSARDLNGLIETPQWERAYEPMVPVPGYAFTAQRYMHEFNVPKEHFGHVAISARKWAQMNPDATIRSELTMEGYLNSPKVADQLAVLDCCLMSDCGGLSCMHPGMYGLFCLIEAASQIRGDGGDRQIEDVNIAIALGNGGTFSNEFTTVLGSEAAP